MKPERAALLVSVCLVLAMTASYVATHSDAQMPAWVKTIMTPKDKISGMPNH